MPSTKLKKNLKKLKYKSIFFLGLLKFSFNNIYYKIIFQFNFLDINKQLLIGHL